MKISEYSLGKKSKWYLNRNIYLIEFYKNRKLDGIKLYSQKNDKTIKEYEYKNVPIRLY